MKILIGREREIKELDRCVASAMVTTYGIADGVNSGVVQQEIVMDDLFN